MLTPEQREEAVKSEWQLSIETTRRCRLVLVDFQNGATDYDEAVRRLHGIDDSMHEENPHAEPDGEITYAVSLALERLQSERNHQHTKA